VTEANLEVHDVIFLQAASFEATHEPLKEKWYGNLRGLHIDSYMQLDYMDGHQIEVKDQPSFGKSLYMVNIGGYTHGELMEKHNIELLVASSEEEAKTRVKAKYKDIYYSSHVDNIADVSDLIDCGYVHLTEVDHEDSPVVITGYYKI